MSGQTEVRYNISAVSQADPCVVTTDGDHAFLTGNYELSIALAPNTPTRKNHILCATAAKAPLSPYLRQVLNSARHGPSLQ